MRRAKSNITENPEIAPNGWKGTTYEESADKFTGEHQFVYTDGNGKIFLSEINLAPLEFSEKAEKISRTEKTLIPLSRAVGTDENLTAYISGKIKRATNKSNENSVDSVKVDLDSSRSALVIEPDDLKNFIGNKIDLSLKIEKTELLKQPETKGGELQISYEARGISLPLVK